MKKLFALFLLVALVPFTVGCGLFGDNDDTSPITTSTLTLARLFPAGSFNGSLRGATVISLNYSDLFMNITVNGTKIKLSYKKHTNKAAGVEVEFAAPVLPSVIEEVKGTSVVTEIQIKPANVNITPVTVVTETLVVPSTLTSGTTATVIAPAGASTTDAAPVNTATVETAVLTEVKKTDSTATLAADYVVDSAKFGTTSVSQDSAAPTTISAASSYVFTVTMNQAYTNTATPTFIVAVDNIGTTATFKTITGTPYVSVSWDSTNKKIATVTVTPSTTDTNYQLKAGQTYSIALQSTDATGTDSVKATLPKPYYIKIQ